MDADDLKEGFNLGDWRVSPRELQIAGPLGTRTLLPAHVRLLVTLATRRGEAVPGSELASAAGLDAGSTAALAATIRELDDLLGNSGSTARRRYIVPVGDDAFALIAHFEALPHAVTRRIVPAGSVSGDGLHGPEHQLLAGRAQQLVAELGRRHVFRACGAYLIGMWIVLQVAEVTFEPLHLPGWWMTALTIAAVIGLPIIAVLAWGTRSRRAAIELDPAYQGSARVRLPRARRTIAPVAVGGVVLLAGITGVAWWRSIDSSGSALTAMAPSGGVEVAGPPSIAVLPLVDMSPGGGHSYLGEGLSEELSVRLAQVPGLRVASRTSAFEFKDRPGDVRRIGQSLGVKHVLEGSVRREGENLRVTVQLIDTQTGFHAWAENYDRPWSDVLVVQDDIARAVTQALRVVLTPASYQQGLADGDLDLGAFDDYLAGLSLLRKSGADISRLNDASARFTQALETEPGFARAHAGLCEIGVRRYGYTRNPGDLATAEQHCSRALDLDPGLLETEKALAALYVSSGRFAAARVAYEQLLLRHPADADGAIGLGRALEGEGDRAEAERNFRLAIAMEPGFWEAHRALGGFLFAQGRLPEAIEAYRRVVQLTPSSASAHSNLGAALQMHGDLEEALQAYEHSLRLEPSRGAYSNLGSVYYYLGRFGQAADMYGKASALAGHDHNMWGNLGDALWQMAARREEAVAMYRRAIALAERDLVQTPRDAEILAQLAYYYAQTGERKLSVQRAQAALEMAPAEPYVRYYTALAAIGRGESTAAIIELEAAVAAGYPTSSLATAPELAGIRGEQRFAALVAGSRELELASGH
jgi:TolB-like protein/Flp pilus assembly protein TadD